MATVLEANKESSELGGHIASYQSAATLYEVGFNHFWHAPSEDHGGDLVFMQGHCAPGFYARAFLEGRLSEDQLRRFRQEIGENGGFDGDGISSYPHPWLMPDFWQFPTVSMGLGPIMAIYQARFMKYLHGRGIADTAGRKVWGFLGDGETDEPESLGAISMAGREKLDNLIFVVNCNLQRLDGPVRGNGKIIQELETVFRGAGWNVIKVVWGSRWDELLARDTEGRLLARMEEAVDGEYQAFKARDGAYVREHFFGKDPKLLEMVADMSDDEIWALNRGGHDPQKIHAAYAAAVAHTGQPTVILAKTIKGYGMGEAGEGQNITHQQKKMTENALLAFRDRFELDLTDEEVHAGGFHRPPADSAEMTYLRERLDALGGGLPVRRAKAEPLQVPELSAFGAQLQGSGERENSTTMAFVRILNTLLRDKQIGRHVVPIVPDESRTFGMEGMFRQFGIFSQLGQLYQPEDSDQLMFYKEDKKGQILQEGINEPGAFSAWIAAATSYSNHDVPMIPFYIYYSMFGFQRVGDLAWAAGDSRARGFLLGGTAGRTTLNGEGLQHEDGHSHLLASTIPNCVSYDPTYAHEVAVIVQDGLRRMLGEQEDVFYYLTLMNENYPHPAMPEGAEEGIVRGHVPAARERRPTTGRACSCWGRARSCARCSRRPSCSRPTTASPPTSGASRASPSSRATASRPSAGTGCTRPRRRGAPTSRRSSTAAAGRPIASTDYMRTFAEQIRPYLPGAYTVLGTDGFGRSDYRVKLRRFFEVDRHYVAVAALKALADGGELEPAAVQKAIETYGIDPDRPAPLRV